MERETKLKRDRYMIKVVNLQSQLFCQKTLNDKLQMRENK